MVWFSVFSGNAVAPFGDGKEVYVCGKEEVIKNHVDVKQSFNPNSVKKEKTAEEVVIEKK